MKIFDFSNLNEFLNESINESTTILSSEPFYFNNRKTLRMIVSNLNEGKRLVFLIPCNKIIVNSGYSNKEIKSIIKSFSSIKNYLFESINESENNDNPGLPKIKELKQKDVWKTLRFKYPEDNRSGFKYAIIIDASNKFSEQFLHGLVLALRTTSKEENTYRKDKKGNNIKNIYLPDWNATKGKNKTYACCFSEDIQQLPVENFSSNARKLGSLTDNDWNLIRNEVKKNCSGTDINNLKITDKNKTTTGRFINLLTNSEPVKRKTYFKNGKYVTDFIPANSEEKPDNYSLRDKNPEMFNALQKLKLNL